MKSSHWTRAGFLSVVFSIGYVLFAHAGFLQEKELDFRVNPERLASGAIQLSTRFTDPAVFRNMKFAEVDFKDLRSDEDARIMLVKAAFIVNRDLEEINHPAFFQLGNLEKVFPGKRFTAEGPTGIRAHVPLPNFSFGMLPEEINCAFSIRHVAGGVPSGTNLDTDLGHSEAITRQSCQDYNVLFRATSVMNRYHRLPAGRTLMVNYQVLAVKRSAIERASQIPFLNLEKRLISQMSEELRGFVDAMNRKGR